MTESLGIPPARSSAAAALATGSVSRRMVVLGLVVGVPLSAIFLTLALRGLDLERVWRVMRDADPWRLGAAVLALGLVYLLQAQRWRVIASPLGQAPLRDFFAMVLAGLAANNVVPGRPGEFLRGYWLGRRLSVPAGRAFATVVLDRVADVLALLAFLFISLPFVSHPTWLRNLALATVPVMLAAGLLLGAAWWYANRSRRGRARAGPEVVRSRLRGQFSAFVRGLSSPLGRGRLLAIGTWSVLAWLVWAGAAWLVASAVGVGLSPLEACFVAAVINLGVAIPSSPGFIGTYQWLGVAALGLFGVDRDSAFAFSVLLQAAWFLPVTAVGLALCGWWSMGRPGTSARRRSSAAAPVRRPSAAGEVDEPAVTGGASESAR